MRGLGISALIIALCAVPSVARHEVAGCGTNGATAAEVMFLHRQAERMRAGRPKARAAAAVSGNRDIGNIAIIEDSDGVVEKLNQFNLDSQTLTFTPSAGSARYRY